MLRGIVVAFGVLAVAGTLLSFSRSSRWWVRLWDFPRLQIAAVAAAAALLYALFFRAGSALDWAFLAAVVLCVLWQLRKVFPYTPLAPVRVEPSRRVSGAAEGEGPPTFRLLVSNVLMENREYHLLLEVVRETDPDLVLALETDAAWARALEPLSRSYPYVVRQPQDNYYGLMLFSRLPLIDPRVEFQVQDDIPSVRVGVELAGGERIVLHGLHPRPPEPVRDQDATPRDAELVITGKEIRDAPDRPTVVAGDLNDVAWSATTELFLRLSGLLDPRLGRGLFNSFNANNPLFRWPLDHIFHSNHFRLVQLRRLSHIGSDHFPMLVELSLEPDARREQPATRERPQDEREAEHKVAEQRQAARTGDDRPGRE